MCLAVPMKILSKKGDSAVVSSGGTVRKINIALLKNVKARDYVMVHAGFAIERLDKKRAKDTLDIMRHIKPL